MRTSPRLILRLMNKPNECKMINIKLWWYKKCYSCSWRWATASTQSYSLGFHSILQEPFVSKKVLILCNYARLSKFSKNPKKVKNDLISRVLLLHLKQILSPWKNRKSVHLHYFLRCGRKTLKGQFKECKKVKFYRV